MCMSLIVYVHAMLVHMTGFDLTIFSTCEKHLGLCNVKSTRAENDIIMSQVQVIDKELTQYKRYLGLYVMCMGSNN